MATLTEPMKKALRILEHGPVELDELLHRLDMTKEAFAEDLDTLRCFGIIDERSSDTGTKCVSLTAGGVLAMKHFWRDCDE